MLSYYRWKRIVLTNFGWSRKCKGTTTYEIPHYYYLLHITKKVIHSLLPTKKNKIKILQIAFLAKKYITTIFFVNLFTYYLFNIYDPEYIDKER